MRNMPDINNLNGLLLEFNELEESNINCARSPNKGFKIPHIKRHLPS